MHSGQKNHLPSLGVSMVTSALPGTSVEAATSVSEWMIPSMREAAGSARVRDASRAHKMAYHHGHGRGFAIPYTMWS